LEVEPIRWETPEVDDRIVDDKGDYIVSKRPWLEGELAYKTPEPPSALDARFGYQMVVVKKHVNWWTHYRKYPRLSLAHLSYNMIFIIWLAWLLAFIQIETQSYQYQMMAPGAMAGEVLGKGDPTGRHRKITVTKDEQDDMMRQMQSAYLGAKDQEYRGNKDYQMKKIPRPKEFKVEDYMRS
jgi:hypothetical protein